MEAKQTPLIELLEQVPHDARVVVEHDQFSSSSHPVGRLCHEADAALRARLAQPKHHDPIGDAQDKLIAEQTSRSCKVGGPCVPTQTGPCACKELPPPIVPVVEQPQMQPCAGRNCGSTNPNLHSAECFEDYEKSTGMNQWQGLTDEEINSVRYKRDWTAPWTDTTFAHAIEAKLREKNHG